MNKKCLIATLIFVLLSVGCSISDSSGNGTSNGEEAAPTFWVEDISIGPEVVCLSGLAVVREVTVNLRVTESAFRMAPLSGNRSALYDKLIFTIELRSGDYYYGFYRVLLKSEFVSHYEEYGVDLVFPLPAGEPVFFGEGEFSTEITSSYKQIDLITAPTFLGLHDNPYQDCVE